MSPTSADSGRRTHPGLATAMGMALLLAVAAVELLLGLYLLLV